MDKGRSLVKQLNEHRPDMPPCEDLAIRDRVEAVMSMKLDSGEYKGMSYIEAIALSKMRYSLDHPESYSLGDLAKITADRKKSVEVDAGSKLLECFSRFDEPAEEVLPVGEGIK